MDGMTPGIRTHKSASLLVAVAQGLPVEMWEKTREIQALKSDVQGRGDASALMGKTCREADKAWLTLVLMPEADESLDRLKRFYTRFGFEEVQANPCLMIRSPERGMQ